MRLPLLPPARLPVLFLLLLAGGSPAGAAPGIFELAGDWRGSGVIREGPGRPAREGRCRFTATVLEPGREMRLRGRCATPAGSADLSMRLVLLEAGLLAGGVASSLRQGTVQFDGRLDGEVARLRAREPVVLEGIAGMLHFSLDPTPGAEAGAGTEEGFVLRQWLEPANGAAPVVLVEMRFRR